MLVNSDDDIGETVGDRFFSHVLTLRRVETLRRKQDSFRQLHVVIIDHLSDVASEILAQEVVATAKAVGMLYCAQVDLLDVGTLGAMIAMVGENVVLLVVVENVSLAPLLVGKLVLHTAQAVNINVHVTLVVQLLGY